MIQKPKTRPWAIAMAISALALVVAPLAGQLGTAFGMIGAFEKLREQGGANPEALSQDISLALNTTIAGLAIAAVALAAFIISLIGFLRAKRPA